MNYITYVTNRNLETKKKKRNLPQKASWFRIIPMTFYM